MARYKFRLETLRRLREIHRDEMRGRLAEAYQAERILEDQRQANADETAMLASSRRAAMQSQTVDVNDLLASQRYELVLQVESRTLAQQAAQIATEVENRRVTLVEADRQVRVLDKLEERQRQQHGEARARLETKQLDEVAVQRFQGGDQ